MKNGHKQWPPDAVVEEVRAARRKLWKESGGTFEGLSQLVDKMTAEKAGKGAAKRKKKSRRPAKPSRLARRK